MGDFKNALWRCGGCGAEVSQRFHVPTDGDPETTNPAPPAPWEVRGADVLCGDCVASIDAADVVAGRTYSGLSEDAAAATWQDYHICLRCAHMLVCKHAPDDEGAELLVTVSACRVFEPAKDSQLPEA